MLTTFYVHRAASNFQWLLAEGMEEGQEEGGRIPNVTVATGHEVNVVIVNLNLSFCHKAKKPFFPDCDEHLITVCFMIQQTVVSLIYKYSKKYWRHDI